MVGVQVPSLLSDTDEYSLYEPAEEDMVAGREPVMLDALGAIMPWASGFWTRT